MEMDFITGEPAIAIGSALVVADLHIGAEHDYRKAGISMPSHAKEIEEKLASLLEKTGAKRLIILGDVKHRVPGTSFQEGREVPAAMERLARLAKVEVVPGNHDGDLAGLCPWLKIHPAEGLKLGDFCLCHGHAWPGRESMGCKAIIIGHNHPQVEFRDKLGKAWRERAWIRAGLARKKLEGHYGKPLPKGLPELVIMPAFGSLVGGWAMNNITGAKGQHKSSAEGFGPITRCADMKRARAFLLDGTFLGELGRIGARKSRK